MYDLLDRPVAELPAFEHAVLLATRRWVHALTLSGVSPASPCECSAFDTVMAILERDSLDTLVLQRPCFATVEETEAVLLGLWRQAANGHGRPALAVAAALVGDAAPRLVAAMAAAALDIG